LIRGICDAAGGAATDWHFCRPHKQEGEGQIIALQQRLAAVSPNPISLIENNDLQLDEAILKLALCVALRSGAIHLTMPCGTKDLIMQTNRMPEEDFGVLRIFSLMAEAMTLRPAPGDRFERHAEIPATRSARDEAKPRLLDRLDNWFWIQRQNAVDAYLAKSSDVHELELRIRHLERGPEFVGWK
jgi:hypothetical protein